MARAAHAMALESERVTADVVEVQEYPHLAQAYRVMGVPKTVINDRVQLSGAVTEEVLLRRVLEAVGAAEPEEDGDTSVSEQTTPVA